MATKPPFVDEQSESRDKSFLIRFKQSEHEYLVAESRRRNVSIALLIRQALDKFLSR